MSRSNPIVIPRNQHIESVLQQCIESKTTDAADTLLNVLRNPYKELPQTHSFNEVSPEYDRAYQTFCGT